MKVALGYTAIAIFALFMATELVTTLRAAVDAPVAAVNKILSGAK
jgi:hypothetical protein